MKNKGFTLVELMITLAIFTIFSVYLYQTFFSQIRQSFSFNNNIDIQYNINKALGMITDQIRSYDSTDTKVLKFSDNNNTEDKADDAIKEISIEQNGEIQISTTNDSGNIIHLISSSPEPASPPPSDIEYDSDSRTLYLKNDNQNKCSNIDSVNFSLENGNEVLKITVSASEGDIQITGSTAVNIKK